MSRLLLLCPLLRHRVVLFVKPGGRLTHSERARPQIVSPLETIFGLAVIFTACLTPAAYVLSNLNEFKSR